MEEVIEFKYLGTMLCKYGEMEGKIRRDGCERQVCHKITCKDYERKECVQHSAANTDVWITELVGHGIGHSSQECVVWK